MKCIFRAEKNGNGTDKYYAELPTSDRLTNGFFETVISKENGKLRDGCKYRNVIVTVAREKVPGPCLRDKK